jgi:CO/xanthine dehydrogenase Mo-binding subunit
LCLHHEEVGVKVVIVLGFGSKYLWQHQILAAAALKLSGRPVRIALSREGVYRIVGGRTTRTGAKREADAISAQYRPANTEANFVASRS